ncbi:TPA: polyprenyl synthetase family protein [archaeon]|nr:polyprenyl synthetase family protein [Candidatus Naiadarchaeales archaeon SRR2090153.bin461]
MKIEEVLAKYAKIAEAEIRKETAQKEPKELYDLIRYHMEAGGKRVRPVLCLVSCEAVGGKTKDALPIATAIELLHGFTLIHDDIEDRDEIRRGKPTVWKQFGEALAINAGDGLFTKAFQTSIRQKGENVQEILEVFTGAVMEVCEGQALDISFEKRWDVDEKEYLEMSARKTGALIEASCKTGALAGNGSEKEIAALGKYGRKIGVAFQVWDDYIDFASDKTGKTFGLDIKKGKKTLIVCHALSRAKGEDRAKLLDILETPVDETSDEMVKEAVKILNKIGSIDYANQIALKLANEAKSELKVLKNSNAKKILLDFADYVVKREY